MAWLTQEIADNLLGNARPRSFAKCQEDAWWKDVFDRWWHEAALGKPMYDAVYSMYNDLNDYYANRIDVESLSGDWLGGVIRDRSLIDAGAFNAFATAVNTGADPNPALDRLWYAVAAQLDMVYGNFYDDVGRAKDAIRAQGLEAAIAEAFPTL